LNVGDESLLYLPIVIGAAIRFGFGPACVGAIFSFCCWDYFFDVPYYALTISNAHDFISLVIYLVVAVTVALLASRAKIRSREAESRSRQAAVLKERNRLARDLHDTLSHKFTGIKFLLEAASRIDSPEQSSSCVSQAMTLAIEGAQEARRSVLALRPAALEEAGNLVDAIRAMATRQTLETKVLIETRVVGNTEQLSANVEEHLLRITQEALTNALRHSGAQRVSILIQFQTNSVSLTVEDNGIGFDSNRIRQGFGLTSMRERAELLSAMFKITSEANMGTVIRVVTPIIQGDHTYVASET
jgi:signal transduction histidine kinase